MQGLTVDVDERIQVYGQLYSLLRSGSVIWLVEGQQRVTAIEELKRQCIKYHSTGRRCEMLSNFPAMDRCCCAAALMALHDIDPDEVTEERLKFILGVEQTEGMKRQL